MSKKAKQETLNSYSHLLHEYDSVYTGRYPKLSVHDLVQEVRKQNDEAIAVAVSFIELNTRGYWHNRARANLCRYFKRSPPSKRDCERIASSIAGKLITGRIDEQFKDQLRFAVKHAPDTIRLACYSALESELEIAKRYANWTLDRLTDSK